MKHVTFFMVLVLLTMAVGTLGFAGKATDVRPLAGVAQGQHRTPLSESDIPDGRAVKSATRQVSITESATPIPPKSTSKNSSVVLIDGLLPGNTYQIGGTMFPTIYSAVSVLNAVGVAGNVTFELINSSYTEMYPATIGYYDGCETYTVTFKPAAGVNATVYFTSTLGEGKGFAFNGAKNVTIDGVNDGSSSLTLDYVGVFPTNDAFAATVYITGASEYIAVKNTNIKGQVNTPVWLDQTDGRPGVFVFSPDTDPAASKHLTIDGCTITNATYAIKVLPGLDWINLVEDITINGNHIGGAYGNPVVVGGWYECVGNVTYTNNIVDGTINIQDYWYNGANTEYEQDVVWGYPQIFYYFGQSTGGHFILVDEGTFANNIHRNISSNYSTGDGGLTYATRIYGYNLGLGGSSYRPVAYNNVFYNIENGDKTASLYGFRGPGIDVYHNSVYLSGAVSGGGSSCMNGATYVYNNVFSNTISGQSASAKVGVTAGSTFNYNAIYVTSPGRFVSGYSTANAAVAAGANPNGTFGDPSFADAVLHLNTAGPSSAENIGGNFSAFATIPGLATDLDDNPRAAALGADAGAYEYAAAFTTAFGPDIFPTIINPPPSAGPTNLAQVITVQVKNNSIIPVTATFSITASEPTYLPGGTTLNVTTGLAGNEVKSFTLPATWTPLVAGNYTMTASVSLAGDVNLTNDIITKAIAISDPEKITAPVTKTFDTGTDGWTGAIDWVRSGTFTKLGGVYGGSGMSWVTNRPNLTSTYTEGAYANTQGYSTTYPGANLLTSPWYDLSGLSGSDMWISFLHSIRLEPDWDRGWMEYTTNGLTWNHLGTLNDPMGVNWYSEAVYQNAHSDDCDGNIDEATLILYGLITSCDDLPIDTWATNGDGTIGVPEGPDGWVYVQLKINSSNYPDILHAPVVKFRYVAFSDAATAMDPGGWAFDNFQITNAEPVFLGGTITGTVYHDVNGNGSYDAGEEEGAGVPVARSYYGVPVDATTTDGNGVYTFTVGLPGLYNLKADKGVVAWTEPYGVTGIANVLHPSLGGTMTQNLGWYGGKISGMKFNDKNDNHMKDLGEEGLGGWTIELHQDSANLALIGTTVTDENGEYSFVAPPGNFALKEIAQPTVARQTLPEWNDGVAFVTISSETEATDVDFGNFVFNTIAVEATVDRNGNGLREAPDYTALPAGTARIYYDIYKNDVYLTQDTLSDGTGIVLHYSWDIGTYKIKRVSPVPTGWIETTPDEATIVVSTGGIQGGIVDTANFLYFKRFSISGMKFDDKNGNGLMEAGDVGLGQWTINLTGPTTTSTVTSDLDGSYSFNDLGPGHYTISEVLKTGWTQTAPAAPGTYVFDAISGNLPGANLTSRNFGNFKNVCISGIKYRDRNKNGVMDSGEEGLTGWTINNGAASTVTGTGGSFSFCDLGPGTYSICEVLQTGWEATGDLCHDVTVTSGVDVTNLAFGNFLTADDVTYRTFICPTLEDAAGAKQKPVKPWTAKKPTVPNYANILDKILKAGGDVRVGLSGQMNAAGKEKAYLKPAKYGDVWTTLNNKGAKHTGTPRGFDFTSAKWKPMLKRYKSMAADKVQNNHLLQELLVLSINIAASDLGVTQTGYGNLIYNVTTTPVDLKGKTIREIKAIADDKMTNYEFVTAGEYAMYDAVATELNAAFDCAFAYNVTGWETETGPVLFITGCRTVYEVPGNILLANPGLAPVVGPIVPPDPLPTVYALGQNYPNPFNPTTTVSFDLPEASLVTLKIYNMLGQEVATLLNRQEFEAGVEEVDFDASTLASGVYLYRIVAEQITDEGVGQTFTQVKKMVLMK